MSKNSTFAWFFLPKSLYYQWLFVSLQRQSSPSLLTMLKSCEAFFLFIRIWTWRILSPFTKRFESSENLVNLLESRGLQICDRNKAIQYLDNIGYYRLSAYMYPLLKMPKTAHLYKEGSTFKKVMMLYRFDKKLRLLMFNEIEKIEIAIRRAVMQTNLLRILPTIVDFRWTAYYWNVNAIYRNIKQNRIRKCIAKHFGLPIKVFESWLTIIAVTLEMPVVIIQEYGTSRMLFSQQFPLVLQENG